MKLLKIEWLKLSGHPFFWIGMFIFGGLLTTLLFTVGEFNMGDGQQESPFGNLSDAGVYKIENLWHGITYMPNYIKFIPAFLLIFFVSNEYTYRTARQNLIDGLSKSQFFVSKVITAFLITLFATLIIVIFGSVLAFSYNEDLVLADLFTGGMYILAYFNELLFFMAFALFATVLLKRSAITIIALFVYYIAEEILQLQLGTDWAYYFPTQPSRELNNQPFTQLFNLDVLLNKETVNEVSSKFMIITFAYTLVFFTSGYLIFKSKNI